jgi:hypothetical protein
MHQQLAYLVVRALKKKARGDFFSHRPWGKLSWEKKTPPSFAHRIFSPPSSDEAQECFDGVRSSYGCASLFLLSGYRLSHPLPYMIRSSTRHSSTMTSRTRLCHNRAHLCPGASDPVFSMARGISTMAKTANRGGISTQASVPKTTPCTTATNWPKRFPSPAARDFTVATWIQAAGVLQYPNLVTVNSQLTCGLDAQGRPNCYLLDSAVGCFQLGGHLVEWRVEPRGIRGRRHISLA